MAEPKIYADAYQLTVMIFNRTKNYPKVFRSTLGRRLEESSLDLLSSVRAAHVNKGQTRMTHLLKASKALDDSRILVQLAKDMQIIPVSGFAEISELSGEVGKEIGGLIKYAKSA